MGLLFDGVSRRVSGTDRSESIIFSRSIEPRFAGRAKDIAQFTGTVNQSLALAPASAGLSSGIMESSF